LVLAVSGCPADSASPSTAPSATEAAQQSFDPKNREQVRLGFAATRVRESDPELGISVLQRLGLTDDKGVPTENWRAFVDAMVHYPDPHEWGTFCRTNDGKWKEYVLAHR
jgi:hypothetical protein